MQEQKRRGRKAWQRLQVVRAIELYQSAVLCQSQLDLEDIRTRLCEVSHREDDDSQACSPLQQINVVGTVDALHQIVVRDGKGEKDRVTVFPEAAVEHVRGQIELARQLHELDLAAGFGGVWLTYVLARKYPKAERQFAWQFVFPASKLSRDPRSHEVRRHSFATHVLVDGKDIRTVQKLPGHKDVSTTMIYEYVLNRPGISVRSPADMLGQLGSLRHGMDWFNMRVRQKTGRPHLCSRLGNIRGEHDERRQVAVLGPYAVTDPRAETRPFDADRTGVDA